MSKKKLSITEIENKTKKIIEKLDTETFIKEFLLLFDIPRVSINRAELKEGNLYIKNKVRFREVNNNPLKAIDEINQEIKDKLEKPRYIISTDYKVFYAQDVLINDSLVIEFEDLPQHVEFFLGWNGIEKVDYSHENLADIKAAKRFNELYSELLKINQEIVNQDIKGRAFNLFLIRSLFLLFSEDTGIIKKNAFTNILKRRTKVDGSDLNSVIKELFAILDIPKQQRQNVPEWLKHFPYVNGELFKEPHTDLIFSELTRDLLIKSGELLNWNEINPDILGSMIQAVADEENRHVSGMHYTSVSNILKLIKPLFLDKLYEIYDNLSNRANDYSDRQVTQKHRREQQRQIIKDLQSLIERMSKIKFLDPACGSGNFLIITYKELRRIEIKILIKIREIQEQLNEKNVYQGNILKSSKIKLSQFNGIEIDDFAHEVAKLSLYIAEHQMNAEMTEALADYQPYILPLKESGNIINGNSLRLNWQEVFETDKDTEFYIMGNPPYIGSSQRNDEQKEDMSIIFKGISDNYKRLDYISAWFIKSALFIEDTKGSFAFVTTNSITQGNQIEMLWPLIWNLNIEIGFTHQDFKWNNSALNNAGVTVVIIGLRSKSNDAKFMYFENGKRKQVKNINGYLADYEDIVIVSSENSISNLPKMRDGNNDRSYQGLIFKPNDYIKAINEYPELEQYMVKYIGGTEYINETKRYALFINEEQYNEIKNIELIKKRMKIVEEKRKKAKDSTLNKLSEKPWKFRDTHPTSNQSLIIPYTSSENREYVPMGFVGKDTMPSAGARVIYDAPIWLLGILSSKMHIIWLKAVGGKLETRYRYSVKMVYNTFPLPQISTHRKNVLEEAVLEMLDIREEEGGTLADLYGGINQPMNVRLRRAHQKIDGIVERAYRQEPFNTDEERLNTLFKYYSTKVDEK